jgi:hypothetical protein
VAEALIVLDPLRPPTSPEQLLVAEPLSGPMKVARLADQAGEAARVRASAAALIRVVLRRMAPSSFTYAPP